MVPELVGCFERTLAFMRDSVADLVHIAVGHADLERLEGLPAKQVIHHLSVHNPNVAGRRGRRNPRVRGTTSLPRRFHESLRSAGGRW
jgi:hypothetical protein